MADPRTAASWPLVPHTGAKLALLRAYLGAWFPILSRGTNFDRIIYIDGFAGPGRYTGGEDGSPIVALKAALGANIRLPFEFHFVEHRRRAVNCLNANIDDLREQRKITSTTEINVHAQLTFEEAYNRILRQRLVSNPHAPAFALLDPFGWKGLPMRIMTELIRRPSTEIVVNFMFEEINRFLNHPKQEKNFDGLFGCPDWRRGYELTGASRRQFIYDLFRDRLRLAARYVRSFEMRNERGASDYFLFFATNSYLGLKKMKEAMWRVDPGSGSSFSDATNLDQMVLFQQEPDRQQLRRLIALRFTGNRATVDQIEHFVVEDTGFNANHYKGVLLTMEMEGSLTPISPPLKRRRGTFGEPALVLQFV